MDAYTVVSYCDNGVPKHRHFSCHDDSNIHDCSFHCLFQIILASLITNTIVFLTDVVVLVCFAKPSCSPWMSRVELLPETHAFISDCFSKSLDAWLCTREHVPGFVCLCQSQQLCVSIRGCRYHCVHNQFGFLKGRYHSFYNTIETCGCRCCSFYYDPCRPKSR